MSVFRTINQSVQFPAGYYSYGFEDDIFELSDWSSDFSTINETLSNLHADIVENGLVIPTDINYALNTSGFEIYLIIPVLLFLTTGIIARRKKGMEE